MFLNARLLGAAACTALVGCSSVGPPPAVKAPVADGASIKVEVQTAGTGIELWSVDAAQKICTAPCTADLVAGDAHYEARVVDLPDSPPFRVPKSERAVVEVRPAAKVLPGLGAVTGTVGAAAMIIGGAFALGDALGDNPDLDGAALPGGLTAAAGGAVLAAGIVMVILSGTRVELHEAEPKKPNAPTSATSPFISGFRF